MNTRLLFLVMGRLDDAAKRKVVELREAGLSFRKIKAILELENIKVSAQAIFLFLREFQGKTQKKDGSTGRLLPMPVPGRGQHLRNLCREASQVAVSHQALVSGDSAGQPSGMGAASFGDGEKDEDVRIISVTSLADGTQQTGIQRSGVVGGAAGFIRRRHTPSPANPMLVREGVPQSSQQVSPSPRRDPACISAPDGRKLVLPQSSASYDLTAHRAPNSRCLQQGAAPQRRFQPMRVGIQIRPPHGVGIQRLDASPTSSVSQTITPPAPVQNVPNQHSPPLQRAPLEAGTVSALQEQIQALGSELRTLGLALRMIVESQGRMERDQAQQTQIQKHILSTLQELSSKIHPPSPPPSCSLGLGQAGTNQGGYSQSQNRFGEMHDSGLEGIEVFSLDQLSSPSINGFQQCQQASSGHQFTHAQGRMPSFSQTSTQGFSNTALAYTPSQTHTDSCMEVKPAAAASPCAPSGLPAAPPHEAELNIIKVETV
ncbi:hypothetical protein DNTS_021465 [Danionella cerebrum]|uniref:Uncharacterized protein n=1 Tax=Danionella cerebrum TaxID=2873325 RepID=A0A553R2N4_9TELE|nr:hypothetical protein DNTS_021465 [Danionella translucida]